MCLPLVAVAAVASAGVAAAGAVMQHNAQKKSAAQQEAYNAKIEALQTEYRLKAMRWQNEGFEQDVKFGNEQLEYQKSENARQYEFLDRADKNIQQNYFAQLGAVLQRSFEEDMAAAFDMENVRRDASGEIAKRRINAAERGVEGASIDALINDVSRQKGEAITVMELNRNALHRQRTAQALGLKAESLGQMMNMPIRTFQPVNQIRAPEPISPVNPAPPVSRPSTGALVANVTGAVLGGMQNYASWTGQSMSQAFSFK